MRKRCLKSGLIPGVNDEFRQWWCNDLPPGSVDGDRGREVDREGGVARRESRVRSSAGRRCPVPDGSEVPATPAIPGQPSPVLVVMSFTEKCQPLACAAGTIRWRRIPSVGSRHPAVRPPAAMFTECSRCLLPRTVASVVGRRTSERERKRRCLSNPDARAEPGLSKIRNRRSNILREYLPTVLRLLGKAGVRIEA